MARIDNNVQQLNCPHVFGKDDRLQKKEMAKHFFNVDQYCGAHINFPND